MPKYKVLHFLGIGIIGGQIKAQYQLLKALTNDDDFQVGVAIGKKRGLYYEKIKDLSIPIIFLNLKNGFSINFNKNVISELKKYEIHHLHDPSPNYIIYSLLAGKGIKRVFTRRGGLANQTYLKKKLKFHIKKMMIRNYFNGFSGNTKNATESVRNQYHIRNQKIYVLYNGIDFNLLDPKEDKRKMLKSLKVDDADFLVGTACQLVYWKRVDLLIRAFAKCRIPRKKLLIFGEGIKLDDLKGLVNELNLNEKVVFAGKVINMPDYMQVLDCFVLASGKEESFGNAVVEAMYLKIPSVIMNDSDGLKEHIIDNETGFIAKDETDLARRIEFIFNHPESVKNICENASRYVSNKYSFQNMVRAYKEFYSDVVGKKSEY